METKFYSLVDKNLALFSSVSKVSLFYTMPFYFLKMRCNVIFLSTSRSSKLSLSFSFLHQNPVCIFSASLYFYSLVDKTWALFPTMRKMSLVYTIPFYFHKMRCNVLFPSTSKSSKLSLSFNFLLQNPVRISLHPCTCHISAICVIITNIIYIVQYNSYLSCVLI